MTASVRKARVELDLDVDLHKALCVKSEETRQPLSRLVEEAIRDSLAEDAEDLAAMAEREHEPLLSFEELLRDLKRHGKI